jgi:hypothetical protein
VASAIVCDPHRVSDVANKHFRVKAEAIACCLLCWRSGI